MPKLTPAGLALLALLGTPAIAAAQASDAIYEAVTTDAPTQEHFDLLDSLTLEEIRAFGKAFGDFTDVVGPKLHRLQLAHAARVLTLVNWTHEVYPGLRPPKWIDDLAGRLKVAHANGDLEEASRLFRLFRLFDGPKGELAFQLDALSGLRRDPLPVVEVAARTGSVEVVINQSERQGIIVPLDQVIQLEDMGSPGWVDQMRTYVFRLKGEEAPHRTAGGAGAIIRAPDGRIRLLGASRASVPDEDRGTSTPKGTLVSLKWLANVASQMGVSLSVRTVFPEPAEGANRAVAGAAAPAELTPDQRRIHALGARPNEELLLHGPVVGGASHGPIRVRKMDLASLHVQDGIWHISVKGSSPMADGAAVRAFAFRALELNGRAIPAAPELERTEEERATATPEEAARQTRLAALRSRLVPNPVPGDVSGVVGGGDYLELDSVHVTDAVLRGKFCDVTAHGRVHTFHIEDPERPFWLGKRK